MNVPRSPALRQILLGLLCVALSLAAYRLTTSPLVWICFVWCALFLYNGIKSTKASHRGVWVNVAVALMTVGGFEAYLQLGEDDGPREVSTPGRWVRDDRLGYAPAKQTTFSVQKFYGEELLFDVEYTIDSLGLRKAPPLGDDPPLGCMLFFGGSFMFGAGLKDDETLPYQVGIQSGEKVRIYNFGYSGYGPHQMLSALQHGVAEDAVDCSPEYALYQAIPDHVRRAAGLVFWDTHGPRYEVGSDGLIFTGHFDDPPGEAVDRLVYTLKNQIRKSIIVTRISDKLRDDFSQPNIERFVEIVLESQRVFHDSYPNMDFHVLFWDIPSMWDGEPEHAVMTAYVEDRFEAAGIHVHLISDVIPDREENPEGYTISPLDRHPNVHANRRIASYVVDRILG
jgi:hypothetical protein